MLRFVLLGFWIFSSVGFAQNFGGVFVNPVSRDISDGKWVDHANFVNYVAEGTFGLHVYTRNIDSISHLGGFTGTGNYQCVQVKGNYAYVAAGEGGLQIIDVSNPAAMTLVGSAANPDLRVLYHAGQYVYAGSLSKLFIYDVSNPAAITLVSETALPGDPLRIVADRNRLYLALGSFTGGLQVVDISNPAAPVLTHLITYQGFVFDCALDVEEGEAYRLYVAEGVRYHSYNIYDQSVPPVHVRTDSVGGKVSRIAFPGYVVGKDGFTIRLYDNERIVASYYAPGASNFISAPGLEQIVACGDSLLMLGILISSAEEFYEPAGYTISDIYPNPFNPAAKIRIELERQSFVTADLISSLGEKLGTLSEGIFSEGSHQFDLHAQGYTSGIYFVRFIISDVSMKRTAVEIKKAILLK